VLIVGGQVEGWAGPVDVRVVGDRIVGVGAQLRAGAEDDLIVDARGGAVIPGLHDHHVHLAALAAAAQSVVVGPPEVVDLDGLEAALRGAPGDGWIRAVRYHESVAGMLDRRRLDDLVPDRPVRVQHRSGGVWILNGRGLDAVGADETHNAGIERDERGSPTGRLWRLDGWLATRVPPTPLDLATVSQRAAGWGVTGFTDADPLRTQQDVDLLAAGGLGQRVTLMSADGLCLPDGFSAGPRKVLLDDATLPPVGELAERFRRAHDDGQAVAVHCVTRVQLVATLAALADAGARSGDRIEHGGIVPAQLRPQLRELGVTVVTQPNFVAERGDDYLAEVDPDDIAGLYPCATLQAAGVPVAAGTDAPFGGPDPWAAVRAAVHRRTRAGQVLGPDDRLAPGPALRLFLGRSDAPAVPRRVGPGEPADLCVLDRPLAALLTALADPHHAAEPDPVVVTIARGEVIADRR
jgi:predicted amidohydrolase YtcJ